MPGPDDRHRRHPRGPIRSVYLSGRFERRDEIDLCRIELEAAGIEVTSSWLTDPEPPELDDSASSFDDPIWATLAEIDREEVRRSDAIVLFADPQGGAGGSRHVEFGMALAWEKTLIVVGEVENLFQRLPEVLVFRCWPAALQAITDG